MTPPSRGSSREMMNSFTEIRIPVGVLQSAHEIGDTVCRNAHERRPTSSISESRGSKVAVPHTESSRASRNRSSLLFAHPRREVLAIRAQRREPPCRKVIPLPRDARMRESEYHDSDPIRADYFTPLLFSRLFYL